MVGTFFSLVVVVFVVAPGFAAVQVRDWFTSCLRRSDFERTLYAVLYGTAGVWLVSQLLAPFRQILTMAAISLSTRDAAGGDELMELLVSPALLGYFLAVLAICAALGFAHAGTWYLLQGWLATLHPRTVYTRVWDEFWHIYLESQRGHPTWVDILTRSGEKIRARVVKVADYPGERDLLLHDVHQACTDEKGCQRLRPHSCPAWWLPAESVEWIGYYPERDKQGRPLPVKPETPTWLRLSYLVAGAIVLLVVVAVVMRISSHTIAQLP